MTPEQLNAWRIIPRLLIAMYGVLVWHVTTWFMALPDPSSQQAALVSTMIGAAGAFFGFYVNTGKTNE